MVQHMSCQVWGSRHTVQTWSCHNPWAIRPLLPQRPWPLLTAQEAQAQMQVYHLVGPGGENCPAVSTSNKCIHTEGYTAEKGTATVLGFLLPFILLRRKRVVQGH